MKALGFAKQPFLKNTIILSSGVGIAQLISILLQPLLRRLFSVEDFGAFAVFTNIAGILTIVSSLKYDMAIVLPKKTKHALNLFFSSIIIGFLFNFLLLILIFIFKSSILRLINLPWNYSYWLYFIPFSSLLFNWYYAINYFLLRNRKYKSISYNKLSRRTSEGLTHVLFGFLKHPLGLVIGDIVGQIINILSGIWQLKNTNLKFKNIRLNVIKYVLKKYRDFPIFNALPALMNTTSLALPVLFINKFYSSEITGYFDLTMKIIAIPTALITASVSQVLLQTATEKKNSKQPIIKDLIKIVYTLAPLSIIGIIIIQLWGPDLFAFAFGKQYYISGEYTKIIVWAFGIKFIVSPLSSLFPALGKLKVQAVWQICYFIFIVSLSFFHHLEITEFLGLYMSIDIIMYTIYFVLIIFTTYNYENNIKNH